MNSPTLLAVLVLATLATPSAVIAQASRPGASRRADSLVAQLPDLGKLTAALAAEARTPAPNASLPPRASPPATKTVATATALKPVASPPADLVREDSRASEPAVPPQRIEAPPSAPISAYGSAMLLLVGAGGATFGALLFAAGVQMGRSMVMSPGGTLPMVTSTMGTSPLVTPSAAKVQAHAGGILGTLLRRRSDAPPRVTSMIPKRSSRAVT